MCRRAKPTATVLLSGESADEVFGGYPPFYMEAVRAQGDVPVDVDADRAPEVVPVTRGDWPAQAHGTQRRRATRMRWRRCPGRPRESPEQAQQREIFYLYIHYFLPFLLDRKDRMSMAASVEVRVPFCDHRLVQYVWNTPWEMKFAGGHREGAPAAGAGGRAAGGCPRAPEDGIPVLAQPDVHRGRQARGQPDPGRLELAPAAVPRHRVREGAGAARSTSAARRFFGVKAFMEMVIQLHHWMREYKVALV